MSLQTGFLLEARLEAKGESLVSGLAWDSPARVLCNVFKWVVAFREGRVGGGVFWSPLWNLGQDLYENTAF